MGYNKLRVLANKILCYISIFLTPFNSKAKVMNRIETPNYLKMHKDISLIRLGDGEFRIMLKKKGIPYQKYSNDLKNDMLQILNDYKNEDTKYLLSIPYEPFSKNLIWCIKHDKKYLEHFGIYRFYFRYFMNRKKLYGCALTFEKDNEENYKKIWENSEKVIFVHNDKKWADLFEKKYNIKTYFVEVPNKNAYEKIEEIERSILNVVKKIENKEKCCILISAGPCAKILVYRLLKKKIISYDVGHCWDDPLIMPE